jgi:hypothetical protein
MMALKRLAAIFEGALPTRKKDATSPLLEINDNDAPQMVQISVSPPRVINETTPLRVMQPTVTHIMTPNSHQRLSPTPCRSVTPTTPHYMIRCSAHQQNLSHDMLAETVLSLPTGPSIRSPAKNIKDTPIIIMPEMANAVICPDIGKSLKQQELIAVLRYKIKWMRSISNEIRRI